MRTWIFNPHRGGTTIPEAVKRRTERRIFDYADKHHAGKFIRIEVRFRGPLCYIDAYTDPGELKGRPPKGETRTHWLDRLRNTREHLCRIRYFGDEDRWSFAFYIYAHMKYEPSFFMRSEDYGTPEEAFETAAEFL